MTQQALIADQYGTVEVLPQHRLDDEKLRAYLAQHLPDGCPDLRVRQFQGGQSNPTFMLFVGDKKYVLRKKPPGKLLRGAHQVDREYRVMKALHGSVVPVPQMLHLCEDESIIGTVFFVMEYLHGRVEQEPILGSCDLPERQIMFDHMAETLAGLHNVDWQAAGLSGFGRAENYIGRQISTWTRQYEASKTDDMPAMDNLIRWLNEREPPADEATIAHGDFRVGNLMFAESSPRIIAVLDWELSTIGHPLADLGYFCTPWYLPSSVSGVRGLKGRDLSADGLPSLAHVIDVYSRARGIDGVPDIDYFVAFSLFRLAAIVQGVYARGLQGNASNADAIEVGQRAALLAETGWSIVEQGR